MPLTIRSQPSRHAPDAYAGFLEWATSPLVLLLAAALLFGAAAVFSDRLVDSPALLLFLNAVFLTAASILVCVFAANGYLASGRIQMLYSGCAFLMIGIGALITGVTMGRSNINAALTVYNLSALGSSGLHLAAALALGRPARRSGKAFARTVVAFAAVTSAVGLCWAAAAADVIPYFVLPGDGMTKPRVFAMTLAIALITAAAVRFMTEARRRRSIFMRTYSVGLVFTALGLFLVLLNPLGSYGGWFGRFSQYLGNLYFLATALYGIREVRLRGAGAGEAIAALLGSDQDGQVGRILAASLNGIYIFDLRAMKHVYINPAYTRITGYTLDHLRRMDPEALVGLVHPADRHAVDRHFEHVKRAHDGSRREIEYRIRTADNRWAWCLALDAVFTRDPDGAPAEIIGSFLDITDRKRAEQAALESRATLQSALASMTDAVSISDAEGHYIDFNHAFATFHRYPGKSACPGSVEEIAKVLEIRTPDGLSAPSDQWAVPRALRGETATSTEYILRRKDTGEQWVGSYSFGPIRNPEGEIVGAVVARRDITELKKGEQDLKKGEARFRLLSQTTAHLLAGEDPHQVVNELARMIMQHLECHVFFNYLIDSDFERLKLNVAAGVPADTAKRFEYLEFGEGACGLVARQRRPVLAGDLLNHPDPHLEPAGELNLQAFCGFPLISQGKLIGTLSVGTRTRPHFAPDEVELMRTVSDQVAIAIQRVHAKGTLEKTVAERTANLLAANRQLETRTRQLRLLAGELTMAEQRERKRLAQVLHDGLQQLLAAAKLQVGSLVEPQVDVAQAVDHIDRMLNESIQMSRSLSAELSPPTLFERGLVAALQWLTRWMQEKHAFHVTLAANDEADLPEETRILVFESIRELLFNSVKHSGGKTAAVTLTAARDGGLQITVSDEGHGFDPAARASGPGEEGFGLFSIRERIGLIGGTFAVDSTPGRGSRSTIMIPRPEPVAVEAAPEAGRPIRVMVVDDHALFREGLVRLCTKEPDLEVVGQAENGREAIDIAERVDPNVILMDVSMPDVNGIDATAAIHTRQPRVSIIGLSMHDDEQSMRSMFDAGAVDYKNKDCNSRELLDVIRAIAQKQWACLERSDQACSMT